MLFLNVDLPGELQFFCTILADETKMIGKTTDHPLLPAKNSRLGSQKWHDIKRFKEAMLHCGPNPLPTLLFSNHAKNVEQLMLDIYLSVYSALVCSPLNYNVQAWIPNNAKDIGAIK